MALRINTNVAAMSTAHIMGDNNGDLGTRLERISSGKRINTAADDAAGLAVSDKFTTRVRGMEVAKRNALDGVSLVQTADSALSGIANMLSRMRELAVQSASETLTSSDRAFLNNEFGFARKQCDLNIMMCCEC